MLQGCVVLPVGRAYHHLAMASSQAVEVAVRVAPGVVAAGDEADHLQVLGRSLFEDLEALMCVYCTVKGDRTCR